MIHFEGCPPPPPNPFRGQKGSGGKGWLLHIRPLIWGDWRRMEVGLDLCAGFLYVQAQQLYPLVNCVVALVARAVFCYRSYVRQLFFFFFSFFFSIITILSYL